MRYRLLTLMIFLTIGPPLIAVVYGILPRGLHAIQDAARGSAVPGQPSMVKIDARFVKAARKNAREHLRRAAVEVRARMEAKNRDVPAPPEQSAERGDGAKR